MAKTKISVVTKIKTVTEKTNDKGTHIGLNFTNLDFGTDQVEKLREIAESKGEVTLTIEPVQEKLPGTGVI